MNLHTSANHEKKILVVDDEPQIVEILERYLLDEGFQVCVAHDGGEAVSANNLERPNLVLMDLKLPTMNGVDAFREIRTTSDVPVIMLTSRSDEVDRIVGLELGADDYITKPFSPREVVARVKTVLRRTEDRGPARHQPTPDISQASVRIGELEIDFREHEVRMRNQSVSLTPTEFRILETLARSPGMTFTRTQLLDKVKGDDLESLRPDARSPHRKPSAQDRRGRVQSAFDRHGVRRRLQDVETAVNDQARLQELIHDIRNRLSVARATIEAFLDGKLAPTTGRLTSVLQTLDRLNELLEHVKSNRNSVDATLDPIEVDVCELLKREYAAAEAVASSKGVEFAVARCALKAQECGRFIGDPVRVGQIVSNVLANAIKFTPAGGAVFVGCSRQADQLEVMIRDSGPGIAADEGERIFKRGVRGSASHASAGSGFGLAIAKEFVEAHGGSITASNTDTGGARFVVRLPGTVLAIAAGTTARCERCAADAG